MLGDAIEPVTARCLLCRDDARMLVAVVDRSGTPPGRPGHEIAYAHTAVVVCQACAGGAFETRRPPAGRGLSR